MLEGVLLMTPAETFWLASHEDPTNLEEARRAARMQDRELLLCPINNSNDGRVDTGSHWTLLVCWDQRPPSSLLLDGSSGCAGRFERFSYYDSQGQLSLGYSAGLAKAQQIADKVA